MKIYPDLTFCLEKRVVFRPEKSHFVIVMIKIVMNVEASPGIRLIAFCDKQPAGFDDVPFFDKNI